MSSRFAKQLIELAEQHGTVEGDEVKFEITLTQKELGDTIGVTRESINKELKSLRSEGIVKTEGNKMIIRNLNKLKERVL